MHPRPGQVRRVFDAKTRSGTLQQFGEPHVFQDVGAYRREALEARERISTNQHESAEGDGWFHLRIIEVREWVRRQQD